MTGKRGRPKRWINDLPEYLRAASGHPDPVTQEILDGGKQLERLLRDGKPRGLPTELLAELHDFVDLSPTDQEQVLRKYQESIDAIKQGQLDGRNATRQAAENRAAKICYKNAWLIHRIKPNGNETVNSVATRIQAEWYATGPAAPDNQTERGVGGEPPSINTLTNYIKRFLRNKGK